MTAKRWTNKDVALLQDRYLSLSDAALAKLLRCSETAVIRYRHKIGLLRDRRGAKGYRKYPPGSYGTPTLKRCKQGRMCWYVKQANGKDGGQNRALHRLRWLREIGPIPDGYALFCKGESWDTNPSNWSCEPFNKKLQRARRPDLAAYHASLENKPNPVKRNAFDKALKAPHTASLCVTRKSIDY